MKNRLLSITRRMIPYIPELNAITGGMVASVLMQQLDYWFERYPDGFYKFMEPCEHHLYKPGESWTEDLAIGRNEFRNAFDSIGYRFSSKSDFNNAPDKFMGRMYASYVDRKANLTYYFRNHNLVDERLDELVNANRVSYVVDFKADPNPSVTPTIPAVTPTIPAVTPTIPALSPPDPALTPPVSAGVGSAITDVTPTIPAPQGSGFTAVPTTDTTAESTSELQLLQQAAVDESHPERSGSNFDGPVILYYPKILGRELAEIEKALKTVPAKHHQDLLDELEGMRASGKISVGIVPLAKSLIKAISTNTFVASAGIQVRSRREQLMANEAAVRLATQASFTPGPVSDQVLRSLPPNIAKRMLEAQGKGH